MIVTRLRHSSTLLLLHCEHNLWEECDDKWGSADKCKIYQSKSRSCIKKDYNLYFGQYETRILFRNVKEPDRARINFWCLVRHTIVLFNINYRHNLNAPWIYKRRTLLFRSFLLPLYKCAVIYTYVPYHYTIVVKVHLPKNQYSCLPCDS